MIDSSFMSVFTANDARRMGKMLSKVERMGQFTNVKIYNSHKYCYLFKCNYRTKQEIL